MAMIALRSHAIVAATLIAAAVIGGLPPSGLSADGEKREVDCFCSMVSLIANPDEYDGKRIRTKGVATVGFEDTAIYLSSENANHRIAINGIQLAVDPSEDLKKQLHLKWVLVEGTYHKWQRDETRWRGYIDDIALLYAPEDVAIRE